MNATTVYPSPRSLTDILPEKVNSSFAKVASSM